RGVSAKPGISIRMPELRVRQTMWRRLVLIGKPPTQQINALHGFHRRALSYLLDRVAGLTYDRRVLCFPQ
ncbi:MAG: hypothetical protein O3A46_10355, partial [Candidatus Poribacteria bacterium]|nr:hypothetical protein [Candidatus Poribacteria bacterium]